MRNLSQTAINQINTRMGGEPVVVVEIQWVDGGDASYYADRFVQYNDPRINLQPSIIELNNLENVIKISENGRTQNISVKLDDCAGYLKDVLNKVDIHRRPVNVKQWFTNLPYSDAFIIFQGEIASPIEWSEGQRILSFEVVEKIEDVEVGFSPEEGQLDYVSENLVGKPWPMGFGTNLRVQAIQINEAPVGITRNPIAFPDPSIPLKVAQNTQKISLLKQAKRQDEIYAMECAFASFQMNDVADQLELALEWLEDPTSDLDTSPINQSLGGMASQQNVGPAPTTTTSSNLGTSFNDYGVSQNYVSPELNPIGPDAIVRSPIAARMPDLEGFIQAISNQKVSPEGLKSAISQLRSKAKQMEGYQNQFESKAAQEASQINHITKDNEKLLFEYARQSSVGQQVSVIGGQYFPRGQVTIRINDAEIVGSFSGDTFTPDPSHPIINPEDRRNPHGQLSDINYLIEKGRYVVINPGAQVKLISDYTIYYVINVIPSSVIEVLAKRSGLNGGAAILTAVPRNSAPDPHYVEPPPDIHQGWYPNPPHPGPSYQILQMPFTSLGRVSITYNCTVIALRRSLDTFDDGWENTLYVSFVSSVGPNTVDIMEWLIATYSFHPMDQVSFATCRALVDQYPSNFVLYNRKQLIQILEEIAFQSRMAIWLSSGVFHLKYLPLDYPPVDTITEADIEEGSLDVSYSRTEQIVTKMVASYKFHYIDKEPSIIVVRYNIKKYDTLAQNYDYYIYNIADCVYKSVTFWIVRKGNTWKKLKFRTFLHKLQLESFDTVTLNFATNYIANGPVNGIVESASYDSASNTIAMEVWIPVRIGEMDPYPFAFPSGLDPFFYFPLIEEIQNGAVGNLPNALQAGFIFGTQEQPDNGALPSRPNKDWGAANMSDNHQGRFFGLGEFQLGAVHSFGGDQMIVIENVGSASGSQPGVVATTDSSAFQPGQKIAVGGTPGLTIQGVQSELAIDGKTRRTTITVGGPSEQLQNIKPNDPVLHGLLDGDMEASISDETDYQYVNYEMPKGSIPADTEVDFPAGVDTSPQSIPVKITGGTGKEHQAKGYPSGPDKKSIDIDPLIILQIDDSESIPVDTWLFAIKIKDQYYCQPPVWLNDSSS